MEAEKEVVEEVLMEEPSTVLTEAELKEIAEGVPALEQLLSQEPGLKTDIEKVIREHTGKPTTAYTLGAIANGLSHFIDYTNMSYLIAFLSGDTEYGQELKVQASQETWRWLRLMMALYGMELREASAVSERNGDSWRIMNRHVTFDTVINSWGMTIEIIKYNEERIILQENLTSALSLAWGVINALNTIPPEATHDLIERVDIADFLKDIGKFSETFAPGLLTETFAPELLTELQEDSPVQQGTDEDRVDIVEATTDETIN